MFEEIFNRWIDTNSLNMADIIEILVEYNKTFGDGTVTEQQVMGMLQQDPRIQLINLAGAINQAISYIGLKKGYEWYEVYNKEGNLLKRFRSENVSSD